MSILPIIIIKIAYIYMFFSFYTTIQIHEAVIDTFSKRKTGNIFSSYTFLFHNAIRITYTRGILQKIKCNTWPKNLVQINQQSSSTRKRFYAKYNEYWYIRLRFLSQFFDFVRPVLTLQSCHIKLVPPDANKSRQGLSLIQIAPVVILGKKNWSLL
jgi:hypothetical protein